MSYRMQDNVQSKLRSHALLYLSSSLGASPSRDVELFRNIFRHYAAERYEDEEIRKMVLYPSADVRGS